MAGAVAQQTQIARMSRRDTVLLDKLSKVDLSPPDYAQIIHENEEVKVMAEKIEALMRFKDFDFEQHKQNGADALLELTEQVQDMDGRLDRAQEDLSAEIRHVVNEQAGIVNG